jgi:hypothetical protein
MGRTIDPRAGADAPERVVTRACRGSRWLGEGSTVAALLIAVAAPALLLLLAGCGGTMPGDDAGSDADDTAARGDSDAILAAAFKDRDHDLQVQGRGVVVRLLSDDADGDRHQRFIIRLESGQTLLVAHNIDVAPRVAGLKAGDSISFSGVYEWSAEGGTIHWTHLDPDGLHAPGWLRHDAKIYR